MPRENIILACNDCKERNYFTTKNRRKHPERVEWKKYCPRCNRHTAHKEIADTLTPGTHATTQWVRKNVGILQWVVVTLPGRLT